MKAKLTVTIDEALIPRAKKAARIQGRSLSQLIEHALRRTVLESRDSFSARWQGRFVPGQLEDERYKALAKRFL